MKHICPEEPLLSSFHILFIGTTCPELSYYSVLDAKLFAQGLVCVPMVNQFCPRSCSLMSRDVWGYHSWQIRAIRNSDAASELMTSTAPRLCMAMFRDLWHQMSLQLSNPSFSRLSASPCVYTKESRSTSFLDMLQWAKPAAISDCGQVCFPSSIFSTRANDEILTTFSPYPNLQRPYRCVQVPVLTRSQTCQNASWTGAHNHTRGLHWATMDSSQDASNTH